MMLARFWIPTHRLFLIFHSHAYRRCTRTRTDTLVTRRRAGAETGRASGVTHHAVRGVTPKLLGCFCINRQTALKNLKGFTDKQGGGDEEKDKRETWKLYIHIYLYIFFLRKKSNPGIIKHVTTRGFNWVQFFLIIMTICEFESGRKIKFTWY